MSPKIPAANRTVIVAAIDRTPASDPCINTATALAQDIAGAELHFLHVIEAQPSAPAMASPASLLEEARKFVDGVASAAGARFKGRLAAHLAVGDPSREILQLASDLEADVIVVGSHGKKALERMLVGSVSQSVVKKARCAVLVARPKEYGAEEIPEIAPPCPKCLETQRASNGERLWCEQHAGRHAHGRLHYELPQSYGVGSMFIRPDR